VLSKNKSVVLRINPKAGEIKIENVAITLMLLILN